jgi:hypothetical protein
VTTCRPIQGRGGRAYFQPLAASAPAHQSLASGSTSASLAFASPTGGSGTYTGALSLAHAAGSGASVSGAPGSASVSGLEDGDSVLVTCTWTDTITGLTLAVEAVVVVAPAPPAGGWTTVLDVDFTALDAGQSWTAPGTVSLTFSDAQADLTDVVISHSSAQEDLTVASEAGSGLRIQTVSATGTTKNAYVAVPFPAGISVDIWNHGLVEVSAQIDGYTTTGTNSGTLSVAVVPGAHAPTTNGRVYVHFADAASDTSVVGRYSGSSTTSAGSASWTPGSASRVALRIVSGGGVRTGYTQSGSGHISVEDGGITSGWAAGHTTSPTLPAPTPWTSGGYIALLVGDTGSPAGATTSFRVRALRVRTLDIP